MSVQARITVLKVEKSRLAHREIPRFERRSRPNHESDFNGSGKTYFSKRPSIKEYPFEVVESRDPPSVVLADQVKSLDWRARRASRKGKISGTTLTEVQAKIRALLTL